MKEPIRVLQVIGKMDRAGAETMIMSIYRNIDRKKIQFDFLVHNKQKGAFDDEIKSLGGRIFFIQKFNGLNFISYYFKWRHFLIKHPEYKVIHGHIASSAFIYLHIAKSLGLKTIVHSHSAFSEKFSVHDHIISILNYPIRSFATEILAASKRAAVDRFGKKVLEKKNFFVLNNAIDSDKFLFSKEKRNKIRQDLKIPMDALVIGNVGRLVEAKNQKRLISLFEKLVKGKKNMKLLILGEGPLKLDLQELINKKKLTDSVKLVGVHSNVGDYLSAMDIFVFPSLHEGLGISLIEAQCSGLPCVASDTVPVEAKITKLLEFESLESTDSKWMNEIKTLSSMYNIKNRKSRVEDVKKANYDISQTVPQISKLYLELSGGK